jgi:hypothetical protein
MTTRLLPLALGFLLTIGSAFGQGTLNFANIGVGLAAQITNWDGTIAMSSSCLIDLYWAPGVVGDSTRLIALEAPTHFITNGYFVGGARTLPNSPAGTMITAQVRVWDAAACSPWGGWSWIPCASSFSQYGVSQMFQVMLTSPPAAPTPLLGLSSFGITPPTSLLPPRFTVSSVAGNRLVLTWPPSITGTNFVLQQNPDLSTTNWVTVAPAPVFIGPQFQIAIPKPAGTMFYRLVSP